VKHDCSSLDAPDLETDRSLIWDVFHDYADVSVSLNRDRLSRSGLTA